MLTPDIVDLRATGNQPCHSAHTRNDTPEKAAFQTDAHTGEMSSQNATDQPRQPRSQGHDGGMQCDLLRWAADQIQLTPHLQGILIRLVRLMDEQGAIALPQREIAARIGMYETQARNAIKALVEAKMLTRKRRGSVGKGAGHGRQPDLLTVNFGDNAENAVAAAQSNDKSDTADNIGSTALSDESAVETVLSKTPAVSRQSADDNAEKPRSPPVDNKNPAHIRNAGARAEPLTNITTVQEEAHPDKTEASGEGEGAFALTPPQKPKANRGSRIAADWKPSHDTAKMAKQLGIVNGWATNTLASFIDYWLSVPGAKGVKLDWDAVYRNELRKEVHAQRHKPNYEGNVPKGYRFAGMGDDGKARYIKDQRTNVYRS